MTQKYGKYDFKVEPFEEDIMGALSWGTLGKLLLRAASYHAGAHGFGFDDVNTKSHAWVLSRLVIDMDRMPRINEAYSIETWVTRVYRQFTDRHFVIVTPEGERFGQATSIWALIDMQSRQPADLTALPNGGFGDVMLPERAICIAGPSRMRLSKEAPCVASHTAAYSDLDINGHVNSIRYIEMLLNTFSFETLRQYPPRRIEVAYCLESYCGETLDIYSEQQSEGVYAFEIRRGTDCIVKSLIYLK
jgi:acyl-ACP thioesterase